MMPSVSWLSLLVVVMVVGTCSGSKIRYDYGDGSFYTGSVDSSGRPSGEGSYHNRTGDLTYWGNFSQGQWHGYGTWYGSNGDRYEGEFSHGKGSGHGTWYRANSDEMIVGQFRNHMVSGPATWYYGRDHSKRMEGNFRRNYAHGYGVFYLQTGRRYEGMFKKGYAHGQGKMIDKDGEVLFEGEFENGIPKDDVGYNVIGDVINEFPVRLTY